MIVRTETDAIGETHKDEVPTDLVRSEDVPGCTPYLEDCSKEQNAQGRVTIAVRLSPGLCGMRRPRQTLRKGECSVDTAIRNYSAVRIASPLASSSSQRTMLKKTA